MKKEQSSKVVSILLKVNLILFFVFLVLRFSSIRVNDNILFVILLLILITTAYNLFLVYKFIDKKKEKERWMKLQKVLIILLIFEFALIFLLDISFISKNIIETENVKISGLVECHNKCIDVIDNSCSDVDIIEYCKYNFKLDLDGDGLVGVGSVQGIELCEDRIYCPLVDSCSCTDVNITMDLCLNLSLEKLIYYNVSAFTMKEWYLYSNNVCYEPTKFDNSWWKTYDVWDYFNYVKPEDNLSLENESVEVIRE